LVVCGIYHLKSRACLACPERAGSDGLLDAQLTVGIFDEGTFSGVNWKLTADSKSEEYFGMSLINAIILKAWPDYAGYIRQKFFRYL
jgi:hypothetical protein